MICPECNGSGAVSKWNLKDDSGDYLEICMECNGYGQIALVEDDEN